MSILKPILDMHPPTSGSLIAVLQDVQDEYNYLSEVNLKEVAVGLGVPLQQVYSVATFYNAFSLKPKGIHVIQVCLGTACHLKGASQLNEELHHNIDIKAGEVSEDGLFSVEGVRCLGCCSLAPAMRIGDITYGHIKLNKINKILNKYRS